MNYREKFERFIEIMDSDFNWTTTVDKHLLNELIKVEISKNHTLYKKNIIPIAICKNKYDILGYYNESGTDIFVTIHFIGYKSTNENAPYYEVYNTLNEAINKIQLIYYNLYFKSRFIIMIESEEVKKQKSYNTLSGLYAKMPLIYDCLFKMNEYRGKLADIENENLLKIQDLFQFFSYDFVYKIRSIFTLSEIANYADAAIVLRSLTESFFVYKYYIIKNNGNKLENYIEQNSKNTTRIENIINYIAPGYYESIYGELCKFTHGNPLILALFRGNVSGEDKLKHSMYNINLNWFSYIINLTLPLINGYFEMFKAVYKNNTIKESKRLTKTINEIKEFINKDLDDRYNLYESQRNTIDLYRKIINFN